MKKYSSHSGFNTLRLSQQTRCPARLHSVPARRTPSALTALGPSMCEKVVNSNGGAQGTRGKEGWVKVTARAAQAAASPEVPRAFLREHRRAQTIRVPPPPAQDL